MSAKSSVSYFKICAARATLVIETVFSGNLKDLEKNISLEAELVLPFTLPSHLAPELLNVGMIKYHESCSHSEETRRHLKMKPFFPFSWVLLNVNMCAKK